MANEFKHFLPDKSLTWKYTFSPTSYMFTLNSTKCYETRDKDHSKTGEFIFLSHCNPSEIFQLKMLGKIPDRFLA